MLEQFTWSQWFMMSGGIAALYYSVVLLVFYRGAWRQYIQRRAQPRLGERIENVAGKEKLSDASFPVVHELMENLKQVFELSINEDWDQEQIITAIQMRLSHYSMLKGSVFQDSLNQHIVEELQTRFGITRSVEQINSLW